MAIIPEALKNRSAIDNRYGLTDVYIDDAVVPGRRRYGLWKPAALRTLPELSLKEGTYDRYTVTENDLGRLDIIAWQYYTDVAMWWVIALYNKIHNPLTDMVVGQVLLIPHKEEIIRANEERSTTV